MDEIFGTIHDLADEVGELWIKLVCSRPGQWSATMGGRGEHEHNWCLGGTPREVLRCALSVHSRTILQKYRDLRYADKLEAEAQRLRSKYP